MKRERKKSKRLRNELDEKSELCLWATRRVQMRKNGFSIQINHPWFVLREKSSFFLLFLLLFFLAQNVGRIINQMIANIHVMRMEDERRKYIFARKLKPKVESDERTTLFGWENWKYISWIPDSSVKFPIELLGVQKIFIIIIEFDSEIQKEEYKLRVDNPYLYILLPLKSFLLCVPPSFILYCVLDIWIGAK